MDVIHNVLKKLDHHRYTGLFSLVGATCAFWIVGCASVAPSVLHDDREVTRDDLKREVITAGLGFEKRKRIAERMIADLNAEIASFNQRVELSEQELDRKDEMKAQVAEVAGGIITTAASGAINPTALVATLVNGGLFGGLIGLGGDTLRKNRLINSLKNDNPRRFAGATPDPVPA